MTKPSKASAPDRTIHIIDGKWYRHGDEEWTECCDCALMHRVEYKLERGMLFVKLTRHDRLTRKMRREQGISVTRKQKGNGNRS